MWCTNHHRAQVLSAAAAAAAVAVYLVSDRCVLAPLVLLVLLCMPLFSPTLQPNHGLPHEFDLQYFAAAAGNPVLLNEGRGE